MPPLNEATVDLVLLITLEQFEDQATNRFLLSTSTSGECEDSGTTQMVDVKKTPAKILSPLHKRALYIKMYYMHFSCEDSGTTNTKGGC